MDTGLFQYNKLVWTILIFKSSDFIPERFKFYGLISLDIAGVLPLILIQCISLKYDGNFFNGIKEWLIATKANQYGDIRIGWKVLISYLWESEGIVSILYFASAIVPSITLQKKENLY